MEKLSYLSLVSCFIYKNKLLNPDNLFKVVMQFEEHILFDMIIKKFIKRVRETYFYNGELVSSKTKVHNIKVYNPYLLLIINNLQRILYSSKYCYLMNDLFKNVNYLSDRQVIQIANKRYNNNVLKYSNGNSSMSFARFGKCKFCKNIDCIRGRNKIVQEKSHSRAKIMKCKNITFYNEYYCGICIKNNKNKLKCYFCCKFSNSTRYICRVCGKVSCNRCSKICERCSNVITGKCTCQSGTHTCDISSDNDYCYDYDCYPDDEY